jgi:hypothetical protein
MHPDIEKLIKLALAAGEITDKDKAVILNKAEALGEDKDEVELILEGEIALKKKVASKSATKQENISRREAEIKKCPSCGAQIEALQLKCTECGYDFNKESVSSQKIRDDISELNDQLTAIDNEKIKLLGKETLLSVYNPHAVNNKKVQAINTFSLPNTKEGLVQLLIFAYSNFEAIADNALIRNPLKQAWLGKSKQAYNLLKAHREGDNKLQQILKDYSFLDDSDSIEKKKKQIEKTLTETQGSTTKKFLKWGGIGCGSIILLSLLLSLFGVFKMYNSDAFKQVLNSTKSETPIDSLLNLGLVDQAKKEANKIQDDYYKDEANDKIKIYEYKRLLESNDLVGARNKVNSISSDYKRKDALDDIVDTEIDRLIESGNTDLARNKANLINSDYKRKDIIDKILVIEIDKLIENKDFEKAKQLANQINNEYKRKDALNKVSESK